MTARAKNYRPDHGLHLNNGERKIQKKSRSDILYIRVSVVMIVMVVLMCMHN